MTSNLIGIHNLSKSYGSQTLFSDISVTLHAGDRIGMLGPNGAGKSTLLKILMGIENADEGHISKKQNLVVGYACQSPTFTAEPLEDVLVANAFSGDETEQRTLARILLSKAQFQDFYQTASSLSGGWKKRLDILCALMKKPDLLLLDEPTNHMDLEGILWLENFLQREKVSYIVVSHDRYFLDKVCNKMIELNRSFKSGLLICEGTLSDYLEHKEAYLEAQLSQQKGVASVVRDEIAWLRTSPKARTTKSKSRIQRAYHLMDELHQLESRNKTTKVNLAFTASDRETRKLIVGKNLSITLGQKNLFKNLDITLTPGKRLGLVGKNGTGKTTLMKMLAGQIQPDVGTLKFAEDLKLVYFDQHREKIAPNTRLKDALSPNGDFVNYNGQTIHVNGWAKKFLFAEDRLMLPVGCLSGGEQARILIAKLMLEPADVLFLDEPTNDLDIPTLEVMEESLNEFRGAVVLISHDRCLMDRVCSQIIGLGSELKEPYFADYSQWEQAIQQSRKEAQNPSSISKDTPTKKIPPAKLTYHEKKELETMEANILKAEENLASLRHQLEDPTIQTDPKKSQILYNSLGEAEKHLEFLFARWEELSKKV